MPEVHIVGYIRGATGFDKQAVFAKWRIEARSDRWRHLEGETSGRTWLAERKTSVDDAVWNEPLNLSFASTGIQGWPKLFLSVFNSDTHNRIDLAGYGFCAIPCSPGSHVREVVLWRPRGTWCENFVAKFLGGRPQYDRPEVVMTGDSRFNHRCVSTGVVEVEFNIALKGFDRNVVSSPVAMTGLTEEAKEAGARPSTAAITTSGGDGGDGGASGGMLCVGCAPTKNKDLAKMYDD